MNNLQEIKEVEINVRQKYPNLLFGESFNDGHLGGCNIHGDVGTYHPIMWKHLVDKFNIQSVLDIGCGFGFSLKYFTEQMKLDAHGIEGSSKVAEVSPLSDKITVHDYCTGPFIPTKEYDLAWSSEFVEHVPAAFTKNFLETFKHCRYIAMTYASIGQTGHNHVNENTESYWIEQISSVGFKYDQVTTLTLREKAQEDYNEWLKTPESKKNIINPHFIRKGLFFQRL